MARRQPGTPDQIREAEAPYVATLGRFRALCHHLGIPAHYHLLRDEHDDEQPDALQLTLTGTEAIHAFGQLLRTAGFPMITRSEYADLKPGDPMDSAAQNTR